MAPHNRHKTHCKNGHPLSGGNLGIDRHGYRVCRTCKRAAKKKAEDSFSIEQARKVVEGLYSGKTLRQLCAEPGGYMVRAFRRTIVAKQPKLAARVLKLSRINVAKHRTERATGLGVIRPAHRLPSIDAYDQVIEATKALWPPDLRDEVRGDMAEALGNGRLVRKDIQASVGLFVKAYNRRYTKFVPVVGGFMHSLDAKVFDDSDMTIGDTVTRGLWQ